MSCSSGCWCRRRCRRHRHRDWRCASFPTCGSILPCTACLSLCLLRTRSSCGRLLRFSNGAFW
ncbi:hypothetical protein BCR37DRAFT_377356 [Protomyces lactucae-debilis]|uniref:Uncharacterized protein n=1 Tax=Protomyces lactucae-debilis TaxID=2754530 RepID=A0A1Y2FNV8_PROLT|nr:uncharacterized protein BCR37DRAFT_377356 [Protomyces lactucae-debilis]ORY85658.1 hypothetical protein BCR37DRAFT_377356 [Protomyces lactucae-debilis]